VDTFIEAARLTGTISIEAAYSRTAENAESFARKHGIKKHLSRRDAFLEDQDLDFIYVASPNALHYSWTRDALLAGRNVICEKPFVSTARELEELIRLAGERNLFLFEALTIPHLPNYKLIREKLPALGALKLIQLNFSQFSSRYDAYLRGEDPNVFSPQLSGGALMDLNYYNIRFTLGLFGEPENARYYPNRGPNGIDTSGLLIMEYPGFTCSAAACKDSVSRNWVQIQGEKGYILAEASTASNLRQGFTVYTKEEEQFYNVQSVPNVLYYELSEFDAIFRTGSRDRCEAPLRESLKAAAFMEKVRKEAGIAFAADHAS
jgi:predicted dehydrogenase